MSSKPGRVILWVWGDDTRLFIRSGGELGRDWPQNLLARGHGILHLARADIPVTARHVTDPAKSRACSEMVARKYNTPLRRSAPDDELTPGEQATFEPFPDPGAA